MREGEIDIAPGLAQTPGGLRLWQFSDPYMRVPQLVVSDQKGAGVVELEKLDSQTRVAVRMPSATVENIAHPRRQTMHAEGKTRIAKAIAQAIPNGCSLILNIGTTTEAVAARQCFPPHDIVL